jgi:hypothetical protein
MASSTSVQISELPTIVTPSLTDAIPAVNNGVTVQEALLQIMLLFGANIQIGSPSQITGLYSTGTFTPTLTFGGVSTGITYSVQTGEYTEIGNVVFFYIKITLTSKGSASGSAGVFGLPIVAGTNESLIGSVDPQSITLHGNNQMLGVVRAASQHLDLIYPQTASSTQAYTNSDFSNTSDLNISGFYFTS